MRSITAAVLVLLLIIVGLFGIGSWSCNQPPKPDGEPERSQHAIAEYCPTYYGTLIVGLYNVGPFVKSNKDEITAASTFIIAIFTAILGTFTVTLSRSTRIAANAAKRSADAAIAIELPIIKASLDNLSKGTSLKQGMQIEYISVTRVVFSNVGRTKAFPVKLRYGLTGRVRAKKPRYTFVETFAFNDILDADEKVETPKFLSEFNKIENGIWSRICAGSVPVWFYCELSYLDFMQDDTREAAFCWRWQYIGGGMGWGPDDTLA